MVVPVHLLLEILKYNNVQTINNFGLINKYNFIIYSNNKDYLSRFKLKEYGLHKGDFHIYNKIIKYKFIINENGIIDYTEIVLSSADENHLDVLKYLIDLGYNDNDNYLSNENLEILKILIDSLDNNSDIPIDIKNYLMELGINNGFIWEPKFKF